MLSLCRFLAQHPEVLPAELVGRNAGRWLFDDATETSAWGILWSLDALHSTTYLCFSGGM